MLQMDLYWLKMTSNLITSLSKLRSTASIISYIRHIQVSYRRYKYSKLAQFSDAPN